MLQKKRNASITPDQHEIFVDLNESDEVQGYYGDILNILRDIDSYEEDRHSVHNGIGLMAVAYSRHLSSAAEDEVRDKIEDIVNAIYNDKDGRDNQSY